jgi:hypothetical protein
LGFSSFIDVVVPFKFCSILISFLFSFEYFCS